MPVKSRRGILLVFLRQSNLRALSNALLRNII